jgi:UDP-glucose 4-epimerase
MRVLVIGGAGFLGRRVVARLKDQGHHAVAFDVGATASPTSIRGDAAHLGDLWDAVRSIEPEVIVQLAYLLGPETARQPFRALRVNVDGMNNVFEAARLSGVRRVVFGSSVVVHGPQRCFGARPVTESSPLYSSTPYGVMKRFNEEAAELFAEQYDLETVAVRFSNLFGFGRTTGSSGPWADAIVSAPATGRSVRLPVPADLKTSLLYVDDAAEYVARLVTLDQPARRYLTGGYGVSIGDLVEAVRGEVGAADITTADHVSSGPDVPVYLVDNTKIVADTSHDLPSLPQRIRDHVAEARAASS